MILLDTHGWLWWTSNPDKLGKGAPEGVIASEAASNGLTGGALIPLLSLGIPGDSTTAVLIGAFTQLSS